MEHENNGQMCEWCGRHKDGRYMWLRLVLAILIGVFIFLAGIQIGELRGEVYGYRNMHMMRWQNDGGTMMMNMQTYPDTDAAPTTTNAPAPATKAAPAATPSQGSGSTIVNTKL
ncbi:MAG TPA: hypothetical protein VL576_02320 [Candidatus Paceibacterota bacterium]|jgi:hypothetical protein|nr:hypothetical protein [Candidatus Paceibacterota bacterium]